MMYEHHLMEANYAMLEQPLGLDLNLQVQSGLKLECWSSFLALLTEL
jgi:hypothetical protein